MVKGLIGKKLNMTQGFDSHGRLVPMTNILVEPNYVVQVKTMEADGYKAAQIGAGVAKKLDKPTSGHIKRANLDTLPKFLREVELSGEVELGQQIRLEEVFSKGTLVDVVGVSKGKGFAGVVKRHGFAGGPRTHGQSDRERAPGSIGATTTPGRVFKGTKMAGHMGAEKVKVQGLEIMDVDGENNILSLRGSVPGAMGALLVLEKSKKKKKRYHEPEIPAVPALKESDEKPATSEDGESRRATEDTEKKTEGTENKAATSETRNEPETQKESGAQNKSEGDNE